jgi:c-di-GMP-binding flagellar brake protein YcgR
VNELAEKTDFLVARADGRDCMLPRRRRGKIVDLSGSGFAFSCQDEELKEGGFILVSFDISPVVHQKVRGVAKIVQLQASDEAAAHEPPEQRVAVDFHHISEDDQDKIIKYVFSVQRQFLRRHRDSV